MSPSALRYIFEEKYHGTPRGGDLKKHRDTSPYGIDRLDVHTREFTRPYASIAGIANGEGGRSLSFAPIGRHGPADNKILRGRRDMTV